MKRSGIYTITNLVNGKIYVGQSIDLLNRWKKGHLVTLKRRAHGNTYLQRAWNKYGEENFKFEILVECPIDQLCSEEHYWCNILQAHDSKYGYNDQPTHPEGKWLVSEATKAKMSRSAKISSGKRDHGYLREFAAKKRVKVAQYTIRGVFINKFDSITEASNSTGIKTGPISDSCLNRSRIRAGYRWARYEDTYPESLSPMLTLQEQQDISREEKRINKENRQREREQKKLLKEELRLAKLSEPPKPRKKRVYTLEGREKMLANLASYRGTERRRQMMSKMTKGSNNPRAILNEETVYEIRKEIAINLDKKFDSRWDMIDIRNGIKEKFNLTERRFQQIKGFECWKDIVYKPELV